MIDPLYQKEILRLAATAHKAGRLAAPQAAVTERNPLCGDQITLDLTVADGRISDIAHVTRACVLCQASASLLAQIAPGRSADDCRAAHDQLRAFLANGTAIAWTADFQAFDVFAPVVAHPSRHTCVLLPFAALARAFKALDAAEP